MLAQRGKGVAGLLTNVKGGRMCQTHVNVRRGYSYQDQVNVLHEITKKPFKSVQFAHEINQTWSFLCYVRGIV